MLCEHVWSLFVKATPSRALVWLVQLLYSVLRTRWNVNLTYSWLDIVLYTRRWLRKCQKHFNTEASIWAISSPGKMRPTNITNDLKLWSHLLFFFDHDRCVQLLIMPLDYDNKRQPAKWNWTLLLMLTIKPRAVGVVFVSVA